MMENSASNPFHVSTLIMKMNNFDKDYRFMAINDLISELQNDSLRLDSDSERKLTNEVLKLLEDQNLEVQNQAVKCLSYLIRKIKEPNVVNIIRDLTTKMMQMSNDNICGICAIGLKTIITDTPTNENGITTILMREIPKPLIELMNQEETTGIRQMEAFDIMSEVVTKFGMKLPPMDLKEIFKSCKIQLFNSRPSVRKRSIACIGAFLSVSGPEYFDEFLMFILEKLSLSEIKRIKQEDIKTLIQSITALTKQPGRASLYVSKIYPALNSLMHQNEEIQDLVIQTYEILITKCRTEMFNYCNEIIEMLLKSIAYDPYYHYDEDDNMADFDEDEENEEENDEFFYSDDDDLSWKIRRSSVKCLETCIVTYPNMINEFIRLSGPVLIERFNEREETVKREVFQCFLTLIKQIGITSKLYKHRLVNDPNANKMEVSLIQSMLEKLKRQSRSKNWVIRQGMFSLLKEASVSVPNCFSKSIGTVINIALYTFNDRMQNVNLKLDAINLLHELLSSHSDCQFSEYFAELTKVLMNSLNDSFYRLSLESLDLAFVLITKAEKQNHMDTILQIYPHLYTLLRTKNADYEMKEKSINTMCALICYMGKYMKPSQLNESINTMMDRLNNELVRIIVLRAFTSLSKAIHVVNIEQFLPTIIYTITPFLSKADRSLRAETLRCLEAFWMSYEKSLCSRSQLMVNIIPMLQPLISDVDLQLAQSSLTLCSIFLSYKCNEVNVIFWKMLMPSVLELLRSPLLHGASLGALISLMSKISEEEIFDFKEVTSNILKTIITSSSIDCISREVYPNVAVCIAELVVNSKSPEKVDQYIHEFYRSAVIHGKADKSSHQYLSIMILGEIGRYIDMSERKYVLEMIMQLFDFGHETLKSAAAYSLGKMALNRLEVFIPYILEQVKQNPDYQYYLLHSLREIILAVTGEENERWKNVSYYFQTIWNLLIENSQSQEEGVRNIAAECIGKLTLMNPVELMPKLRQLVAYGEGIYSNSLCRATIVTALKFTVVTEPNPIDNYLQAHISEFLSCLKDPDLGVQRAGLITLNTIIHNKPMLIRDSFDASPTSAENGGAGGLLSWLYDATKIRQELIREVEMGPFKHLEDDGLDLRKCAFECISNLLDYCIEDINILVFMDRIEEGLRDNGEIKLLCYPMLAKIAKYYPTKFLDKLPSVLPAIRNLLKSRPKHDAVKQEQEKLDEQKRAAVKFLVYVSTNENLNMSKLFMEFVQYEITGPLKVMYDTEQEMIMQKQKY